MVRQESAKLLYVGSIPTRASKNLMDLHQREWVEFKAKRFRLAKKWLKYLPTRSFLRKNFIFKKLGKGILDKCPQLWSFSYEPMKTAYYAGWILTFMPVMGMQIALAILLAICFKGNVMVLVALQMISNPFTIGFLWTMEYHIGKFFLSFFPMRNQLINQSAIADTVISSGGKGMAFIKATLAICVGALILGLIFGKISCWIHQWIMKRTMLTYEQFVEKQQKRLEKLKQNSKNFLNQ